MDDENYIEVDLQASMDRTIITIVLTGEEPLSDEDIYSALKQYIAEYEASLEQESIH